MKQPRLSLTFAREFIHNPYQMTCDLIAEYGKQFTMKGLTFDLHFFAEPKSLEYILFSNSKNYLMPMSPMFEPMNKEAHLTSPELNKQWLNCRTKVLNKLLNQSNALADTDALVNIIDEKLAGWDKYAKSEQPVNIHHEFTLIACSNFLQVILGNIPLDPEYLIDLMNRFIKQLMLYEVSMTKLAWTLPTRIKREAKQISKDLADCADTIINYCLLDEAQVPIFKEVVTSYGFDYHAKDLQKNRQLWGVLRAIAVAYLTGGFHTMSLTLTITCAYLSKFPLVVQIMRDEIAKNIGDQAITKDNVASLNYTRSVVLESLRYSGGILPIIQRVVLEDDQVGDIKVKKNDKILIPLFYMGHLPEYWENPEGFEPARFLSINVTDDRYRYIYLPFSAGSHACLGRNFGMLEATILLAMTIRKYDLELLPNQPITMLNATNIKMYVKNKKATSNNKISYQI